jgi:hypothetical protein
MTHFEKLVEDLRREQLARRPVLFIRKSLGPNVDALKRRAAGILSKAFCQYKSGQITGLELAQIENAIGKIRWPNGKRGLR